MKFGIIKERKNPPDRRVVFSPQQLQALQKQFPEAEFIIEPSPIRIFTDQEYAKAGFALSEDLSDCDVLLGVKEVPAEALIPNKRYFFFSHTIKKQPYNRDLLRAILAKNIRLYDHETIVNKKGERLIGFGRYAGIVGAYNGLRAYGLREKTYCLPKVETLPDYQAVTNALEQVKLPPLKIILTGEGKVARGAMEILDKLEIPRISPTDFLTSDFQWPVYCQAGVLDYIKPIKGGKVNKQEFYTYPEKYASDFMKFAEKADIYISGHFHKEDAPSFFTKEDSQQPHFNINLVADISCDINGPIASTLRPSTIADPFYGYDPATGTETTFDAPGAITVMAVDNLPCELPKNASEGFGEMFSKSVMPAFFNKDANHILKRAQITADGNLTQGFAYLQDYVDGKM